MPRKNNNISNYHFRSEITDEEGNITIKHHYTLKEMCELYNTSTFTIYKMMKEDITPRSKLLKNVKFYKDLKPVYTRVLNTYNDLEKKSTL